MQTQTQAAVKPARNKRDSKVAAKAAEKEVVKPVAHYGSALIEALAGAFGVKIQGYYVSALAYHGKKQTVFPRPGNAIYMLMEPKDIKPWLTARTVTSIPPGDKVGQRLFDQMMVEFLILSKEAKAKAAAAEPAKAVEAPKEELKPVAKVEAPKVEAPAPEASKPVQKAAKPKRERTVKADAPVIAAAVEAAPKVVDVTQALVDKLKGALRGTNLQPAPRGPNTK